MGTSVDGWRGCGRGGLNRVVYRSVYQWTTARQCAGGSDESRNECLVAKGVKMGVEIPTGGRRA